MLAAEAIYPHLTKDGAEHTVATAGECDPESKSIEVVEYETNLMKSWVADELKVVRNAHASFHGGLAVGMVHTAFSCFITQGKEPWTLTNSVKDSSKTKPAKECTEIKYPKADNIVSFDLLTNLQRSGTSHEGDQPAHLRVKKECAHIPSEISIKTFAGPEQRFCPAGRYFYLFISIT
jgi:electron-transferring-flavoprotein dehydrogenase